MPSIAEVREKYPQYSDLSDDQLAGALHKKYYSDMPFEDFSQRVGLAPAAEKRSVPAEIGRQVGLAGRYAIEGGTALAQIPASALAGLLDLAFEKAGVDYRFGNQSEALSNLLTAAGLPKPEGRAEEVVGELSRAVAGAGTGVGVGKSLATAASPVTAAVGRTVAEKPLLQGVSGVTGAGGAEIAEEAGAGKFGQMAAALAGAVAPTAAVSGSAAASRGLFRGGEAGRQNVAENIDTFARAGTVPSVGQATQGRVAQSAESLLSRSPGAAGRMASKAEQQGEELAANLERRAAKLVGKTSAEQSGRVIERGIRGDGGFIERFRSQQEKLYTEVYRHIPKTANVGVSNTQRVLGELTTPTPGAVETTKRLVNPRIASIAEGLGIDAQSGSIPYSALRELRTRIGQELSNGLVSDVPAAQWKRLYAALSSDLEVAATAAGSDAKAAFTRANNYTRSGMNRLEAIEGVVNRNGGPEAIFKAATSNTKEGATTLRAVMQSLDSEAQKMVTGTVLRRLGIAKAGVQGELGDRFSTESFLTNWNLLSPEAKRTLFDRYGPTFREDMDAIAKVAGNLRQGSKVFVNPSGTAQATAQAATVASIAATFLTGSHAATAAIVGGVAGANLTARLMTNPRFVRWLARSTKVPASGYNAMVNHLLQQARESGDQDMAAAYALFEGEVKNGQNKANDK